jgi:DNA repair protein RadC
MAMRINIYSTMLVKEKGGLYNLESKAVTSPGDAAAIINEVLHLDRMPAEHFVVMTLTTKNKVAGLHVIHKGSLNASLVHPREVYQQAILNNAASIICFHNHPSGNPQPSNEDVEITRRLVEAGKIIGIDMMDHIIIGENKYFSHKEAGRGGL